LGHGAENWSGSRSKARGSRSPVRIEPVGLLLPALHHCRLGTGAFGLEPSVASRVIEGLRSLLLVTSYNPKETATPDMACD
jgi:hypothetical protein